MNIINTILARRFNGIWVFEDQERGLINEAFVGGIPEIIEKIMEDSHIPKTDEKVLIIFSAESFKGHSHILKHKEQDGTGNTYKLGEMEGWLCAALYQYFDKTPSEIYVQMKAVK